MKTVNDLSQDELKAEYVGCGVLSDSTGKYVAIYSNPKEARFYAKNGEAVGVVLPCGSVSFEYN